MNAPCGISDGNGIRSTITTTSRTAISPTVKGYEAYGKMTKTYAKMKEDAARQKATEFYVKIQIVGTPDDCIQQIAELRALTGTDHLIADFSYGGMPHEEGELNMRLFADRVVPVLQRDALFAAPPASVSRPRMRMCSHRHEARSFSGAA